MTIDMEATVRIVAREWYPMHVIADTATVMKNGDYGFVVHSDNVGWIPVSFIAVGRHLGVHSSEVVRAAGAK